MKASIVTVVYNGEAFLSKTMESVLNQTCTEIEYLIIDGASKDDTVAVAEGFRAAMEEKGITLIISSEPDQGIYDAMNKGIAKASGDVVGILNCGDSYEPETVETALRTFEKEDCDLLFGNLRIHKTDGSSFIKKARLRRFQTSRDWNHPTTFVKTVLARQYPFRKLGIHDDYGFYLQMRKQGRKIVTVDETMANFVMGGVSNRKSLKACINRIRDRYCYCYRINGYSRWYLMECIFIEFVKFILG